MVDILVFYGLEKWCRIDLSYNEIKLLVVIRDSVARLFGFMCFVFCDLVVHRPVASH
jgi:hypothetical protein